MRLLTVVLAALALAAPSAASSYSDYMDDPGDGNSGGVIWSCGWTAGGYVCGIWYCTPGGGCH